MQKLLLCCSPVSRLRLTVKFFFGKLKSGHASDFQNLIDRSNFNRRRKRLYPMLMALNEKIAQQLNEGEDVYLIDSIPIPVCQLARQMQARFVKSR